MKKFFSITTILIILFPLFFTTLALAAVDELNINLDAETCNNDGVCDYWEDATNCPFDCVAGEEEEEEEEPSPGGPPSSFILEEILPRVREEMDVFPPLIMNISVVKTSHSATTSWYTSEPALCQLFWGETSEYKEESISEVDYSVPHKAYLSDLLPETTYHFQIKATDKKGNFTYSTDKTFTTLAALDIVPPANVSNFQAVPGDEKVSLSWQNPPDSDLKAVRIMRSDKFYPADPWDGVPIYNEKGTSFVDEGLINNVRYYYTAFAYDESENYSSGAVASAIPYPPGKPPIIPPVIPPIVPPEKVPPEIQELTLADFDFFQEDKKLPLINGETIKAKTEFPLTVSIDYEKVPEVLKTIMITLKRGEEIFPFLLRIDKEKTKYLATVMPPVAGDYPLSVTVLDFKNQALKGIPGELITKKSIFPAPEIPQTREPYIIIIYVLVAILLIIIYYLFRKWYVHKFEDVRSQTVKYEQEPV